MNGLSATTPVAVSVATTDVLLVPLEELLGELGGIAPVHGQGRYAMELGQVALQIRLCLGQLPRTHLVRPGDELDRHRGFLRVGSDGPHEPPEEHPEGPVRQAVSDEEE